MITTGPYADVAIPTTSSASFSPTSVHLRLAHSGPCCLPCLLSSCSRSVLIWRMQPCSANCPAMPISRCVYVTNRFRNLVAFPAEIDDLRCHSAEMDDSRDLSPNFIIAVRRSRLAVRIHARHPAGKARFIDLSKVQCRSAAGSFVDLISETVQRRWRHRLAFGEQGAAWPLEDFDLVAAPQSWHCACSVLSNKFESKKRQLRQWLSVSRG
jgi:hypothetical protein